jgi:uncharacterized protein (DUF1800 family)
MLSAPAMVALNRFGLGARPGDVARVAADPRAALTAELQPDLALLEDPDLSSSANGLSALHTLQMARKQARLVSTNDGPSMMGGAATTDTMAGTTGGAPTPADIYAAEISARLDRAGQAQIGYVERLVAFWSNHFAVKAGADEIDRVLAGAFERERPLQDRRDQPHIFR